SCGGKWRLRRASSLGSRFFGPVNSSAHSPSSEASTSISPSGVVNVARERRIIEPSAFSLQPSALEVRLQVRDRRSDQMSDKRLLLLDELLDAVVGQIEQRVERIAPERQRFRG